MKYNLFVAYALMWGGVVFVMMISNHYQNVMHIFRTFPLVNFLCCIIYGLHKVPICNCSQQAGDKRTSGIFYRQRYIDDQV